MKPRSSSSVTQGRKDDIQHSSRQSMMLTMLVMELLLLTILATNPVGAFNPAVRLASRSATPPGRRPVGWGATQGPIQQIQQETAAPLARY